MKLGGRFSGYTQSDLRKDMVSGLIVGIIAIPLGMAFAIAAGVKPEYGIYTTIVAGILISLFGGSRYQIGGPTGAFIPILLTIVTLYGYENLLIAGFMAGALLILMGVCRLGSLITYMPKPVTIGFTAGIAIIIFEGQLPNFLGLEHVEKHESFYMNVRELLLRIDTIHYQSVTIGAVCLLVLLVLPKVFPRVPAALVGIAASTVVASLVFHGQAATIGSTFGSIPGTLPTLQLPEITWAKVVLLLQPALMIALLGSVESLLSAVVADGMTGDRHRSNKELIGQGIANMITPLFGGIPATGAIARTATNIRSGAVSPLSGIIHGLVVLLVLLLCAPYASYIPLASLAPILMMVAWNMSERHEFMQLLKSRTGDSLILVVTFMLTVLLNLIAGVGAGIMLALVRAVSMRRLRAR